MDKSLTITTLYSTQSGRAKACARRSSRLLLSKYPSIKIQGNCTFDEFGVQNFLSLGSTNSNTLLLLFVSTTGDGEHTTSIAKTWAALLSKSLPSTLFANVSFALFALGDRAYGDAFCAAGRKLAARLVQLGASPQCVLGYGDDGSDFGVLGDLDGWLGESFFGVVEGLGVVAVGGVNDEDDGGVGSLKSGEEALLYSVEVVKVESTKTLLKNSAGEIEEWQQSRYSKQYADYFQHSCPDTAYQYNAKCDRLRNDQFTQSGHQIDGSEHLLTPRAPPLLASVTVNDRITSEGWMQNTRHIRMHVTKQMKSNTTKDQHDRDVSTCSLPYEAGDVATILPSNPKGLVSKLLSILPDSIRAIADETLRIQRTQSQSSSTSYPWPELCTLRGLLTHCADIQSLPEQEDLYALSAYCNVYHVNGKDQRDKLISLSETSGAALYVDYIIRNKRNWVDLFYDFDSLFHDEEVQEEMDGNKTLFTISSLLSLLPSIAPRHFSIASSPTYIKMNRPLTLLGFELELCVAVVEGTTSLGRAYSGCCSSYLASIVPSGDAGQVNSIMTAPNNIRLWITPGSFHNLPLDQSVDSMQSKGNFFQTPILCVGAGTGIAPLRSLIFEREARRLGQSSQNNIQSARNENGSTLRDNTLVFGCRKRTMDYYYYRNWESMMESNQLRLVPAFSRDQKEKLYVQRALRELDQGSYIAHHILERQGAVYIAGGSKMAQAVRDEIVAALGVVLEGGDADAKKLLKRLKRKGLFCIEAWS